MKNASLIRRVTTAYADQQRGRGAIQMSDAALAALIGATERQVATIRRSLTRDGIAAKHRKRGRKPILTMPDATPGITPDPERLDPSKSLDLYELDLGYTTPYRVVASGRQWAKIGHLLDQVSHAGARILGAAIWYADEYDPDGNPLLGRTIINGLTEIARQVNQAARDSFYRKNHWALS